MTFVTHLRNRYFLLGDLLLIPLAVYASFVLRLDAFDLTTWWPGFGLFTIVAVVMTVVVFAAMRLYSSLWRYASVRDLLRLVKAVAVVTVATTALTLALSALLPASAYPRSIPAIFFLLALLATAGPRLLMRAIGTQRSTGSKGETIPTFIIGAGYSAAMLLRELYHDPHNRLDVVGLIDDDPAKLNTRLHGIRILGTRHDLTSLAHTHHIRQAIIAIPSAPGPVIRELVRLCDAAGIESKILPTFDEMLGSSSSLSQLREVRIEDLLRREPIRIEDREVSTLLHQKRVLVTGAGGSIGSELCRQIAPFEPAALVLLDHSENSLFHIENEIRDHFPTLTVEGFVADIRDEARLATILHASPPDIIFHAAAQKHVPLMERHPCEAIRTNVRGTQLLVGLAEQLAVPRFVMISTDKAVNPTSVMGASKRCAELVVQAAARRSRRAYVAVRFGNVLGSNGSVVPRFQEQIRRGGPVTVTHPEMRRFFMTIPEAVTLVLQAGTLGQNGEVYVLDMGAPVRIADLATDLIRLNGLEPSVDIEIQYTGIRPGEKLYEELFITGEAYDRTRHTKIFRVRSATEGRGDEFLPTKIKRLVEAAEQQQYHLIRPMLQSIVKEFEPNDAPAPATREEIVEIEDILCDG